VGLASTWIVLGYLVATTGSHGGTAGFESGLVWWQYALMQCRVIIHYLKLSVWPHPLVFDYGMPTVSHMSEILPDALVLAALATGTAIALWRRPAVGFLGVWFFAILAPSSSVIPLPTEMIAEHRMYLPLVAVVVLGVMGIHNLVGRQTVAVVVVLAIALGVLTWRRNQDYRSDIAIWDDTVAKCPNNPRARNNLGLALVQVGRPAEAIVQYEQALRVKPDFAQAHYGLGVALARVGRLPEAIVQYEQALRIRPDYAEPHFYLGIALVQLGKTQEATEHYEQALRLKPDYLEAHYNLGVALIRLGKPQEAIRHWEQAVRINPDFAEAHYDLGHASEELGRTTEAIEHYEQALRLRPNLTPARDALARLQGRP
jgi:Flp pilus assembly protein TadD